jgi:hypothetical protein
VRDSFDYLQEQRQIYDNTNAENAERLTEIMAEDAERRVDVETKKRTIRDNAISIRLANKVLEQELDRNSNEPINSDNDD